MTRWFLDRSPQRGIPSVSLRRLLPDAQFVGCQDWEVSGCTADTRKLDPGQVFVAVRGERRRRARLRRPGAGAGRGGRGGRAALPRGGAAPGGRARQPVGPRPDQPRAGGRPGRPAPGRRRDRPPGQGGDRPGSSARSSQAHGESVGSVGRSSWSDGASDRPTGPESPGPEGFASMLAAMVERRCDAAVLELDDRTLDRREVDGVAFESAVVTGLGGPGPARGPDREALLARRRAFARLARLVAPGGSVVIDADEPDADVLGAVNLAPAGSPSAATARRTSRRRSTGSTPPARRFRLRGFDREATVTLRLAGEEHVGHALAAAAVAWSRGIAAPGGRRRAGVGDPAPRPARAGPRGAGFRGPG